MITSAVLLILMLIMSKYWAASNDEKFNVPYADLALDYYMSLGQNDTVLTTTTKMDPVMKHYGVVIELPAHFLHKYMGVELYWIRHFFVTLVSFGYILFGSLIVQRITKSWAGAFLTMLFLVLTPRIFGESFNNPKDPPYCATTLYSLWTFMIFLDALPRPSWRKTFLLMSGIAVSLFIRISGLMTDFLFTLFLAYEIYLLYRKNTSDIDFKDLAKKLATSYIGGYFIGILFWPAMLNSPISQPFDTLNFLKNLPVTVRTLFDGKYISSSEVPWYYLPKYFLIANPEVILLGILLGFFVLFGMIKKYNGRRIIMLLTFSLFPLALVIYNKAGLLTGWRHGYFMYIPLVVFSAIGYVYIIQEKIASDKGKKLATALILIALIPTLLFTIRNFPYFYVYFNPISGGVKKALGRYELDYYSQSTGPATHWLMDNVKDISKSKITSNNGYQVYNILEAEGIKQGVSYSRYRERYDQDWDYGVFTQSFVEPDYLQNGYFPPKGTVKSIDVDGVPICAVIKREDKNDLYGKQAIDSNKFLEAIGYLTKAVQYDPNNELAWTHLGFAQLNSNQAGQAVESLNKALSIAADNLMAKNYLGYAYLQTGNIPYAQSVFMDMIEKNPNMPEPYRIMAQIYQQQGNSAMAQQFMSNYEMIMSQMGGR